ncbi:hypothetical protein PFNF135_06182 [Plasmodium falciparum NF135/5.C10]|uniref:EF-hand domain-containing protein n=1 Tax=Plasmodium falciparum NF135/5.C10 TaxID=1036726 RepID=W4I8S0_PLAFA|nr:hypothetical protein PFNF135_06182 [Plasmodium falciparum NF135/5.C10]
MINRKSESVSYTPRAITNRPISSNRRRGRNEITDEQKNEIKEAFDLFDTEKTGKIDYHELKVRKISLKNLRRVSRELVNINEI